MATGNSSPATPSLTLEIQNGAEDIVNNFFMEQNIRRSELGGRRRSVSISIFDRVFEGERHVLADDQSSPLMADLGRSLARNIQPIEDTFSAEIAGHIQTLEENPSRRMEHITSIIHGVFRSGITAGHVLSLLMFGFSYIHHLINTGVDQAESIGRQIIAKIVEYMKEHVSTWIASIGGWAGFMDQVKEYVEQKLADMEEMRRSQLYKWAIPALIVANVAVITYYWNK